MKLVLGWLLVLVGAAFIATGVPTAWRGGRPAQSLDVLELARGGALARGEDFSAAGVLVRTTSLDRQRFGERSFVPLVDERTAELVQSTGTWVSPVEVDGGRVLLAALDLSSIHDSGLAWDETLAGAAVVGPFRLQGELMPVDEWPAGASDYVHTALGLAPRDVVVLAHGRNSFPRPAAFTAIAMGAVAAFCGLSLLRARALERRVPSALSSSRAGSPARASTASTTRRWGGVAAALLGAAAIAGRALSGLGRSALEHGDDVARAAGHVADDVGRRALDAGAGLVRQAEEDPLTALLRGVDRARDAHDVAQAVELLAPPAERLLRLHIRGGMERYGLEPDGLWHLRTATIRHEIEFDARATGSGQVGAWNHSPRRAAQEDTQLQLLDRGQGRYEACLVERTGELDDAMDGERFCYELAEVRSGAGAPTVGGELRLDVSTRGLDQLAARMQRALEDALRRRWPDVEAVVETTVHGPARLFVRGQDLLADVPPSTVLLRLRPR